MIFLPSNVLIVGCGVIDLYIMHPDGLKVSITHGTWNMLRIEGHSLKIVEIKVFVG